MVNAVRSRSSAGNRVTGLVDSESVQATAFYFTNQYSLRFDSTTSESVQGPAMNALGTTITNQFSVAIWHKWTGAGPAQYDGICNANTAWSSLADGWGIYWQDVNTAKFFVNHYTNNFAGADVSSAGDWNFFVAVYDGTLGSQNIKLYANGSLGATTDTLTATLTGQGNNVEVGKTANSMNSGGTADFMVGNADEFAVWDSPLSADEVTTLYNSGVAGFSYDIDSGLYTSSSNLRLWWRLGDAGDTDGADGVEDKSGNGNHGTLTGITSSNFEVDVAGGGV